MKVDLPERDDDDDLRAGFASLSRLPEYVCGFVDGRRKLRSDLLDRLYKLHEIGGDKAVMRAIRRYLAAGDYDKLEMR